MQTRTESRFCFNCGSQIPPRAKFCNLCGTTLNHNDAEQFKPTSNPFYSDDFGRSKSDFAFGSGKMTCPVCGNKTNQINCEECGTQLRLRK